MKAWWNNLNQRERGLVMIAALLVMLALLWMLIGKPLYNHHRLLQQDLADAQAIQQQLQQQRSDIMKLRGGGTSQPVTSNGSLHSAVIDALKQFQLDGEGSSSEGKTRDSVTMKMENKPFDALARFLSHMDTRYAARVTRMTLKPADKTGAVDAEITLER